MTLYELIYETLRGNVCTEYMVPGVEDAFADGSYCAGKYADVISAYLRICQRLGCGEEDKDLDIILDSMNDIQDYVSRQMFFLGVRHEELLLPLLEKDCDGLFGK